MQKRFLTIVRSLRSCAFVLFHGVVRDVVRGVEVVVVLEKTFHSLAFLIEDILGQQTRVYL